MFFFDDNVGILLFDDVLLIGDQNVGKSNFIFRFTENKFNESH